MAWVISFMMVMMMAVSVDSTKIAIDKIYESIEDDYFCFRRLNSSHEVGCQAHPTLGNVGVLYIIDTPEDLNYVVNHSTVYPFVVMMSMKFFTTNNLRILKDSNKVNGILVFRNTSEKRAVEYFSPDKSCPNDGYGVYRDDKSKYSSLSHCQKQSWTHDNPGLDMMFESWPFPIFLVTKKDSLDKLTKCFNTFNKPENPEGIERPYPLCAVQVNMKMHAAVSSVKCLSRNGMTAGLETSHFCDPLSSKNIFSHLFFPSRHERNQPVKDDSVILVVARLDSFSMFDDISPGASSITGLVTLMSVARTLSSLRESIKRNQDDLSVNVIFAIFDGEAFDYIGSSATAVSMRDGKFPQVLSSKIVPQNISLKAIRAVIELNQLVKTDEEGSVFIHGDPASKQESHVHSKWEEMFNIFVKEGSFSKIKVKGVSNPNQGLPPSSVHSFLRERENIIGLHLANHDKEYSSNYVNSFMDDAGQYSKADFDSKFTRHLAEVSTFVSRSLFRILTGKGSVPKEDAGKMQGDQELVSFLSCVYVNLTNTRRSINRFQRF